MTTRRVLLGGAVAAGVPLLATSRAQAQVPEEGTVALHPLTSDRNVMQSQSAVVLPVAVRANVGQLTNLQEWQDSSGSVLAAVAPQNGRILRPGTRSGHGPFVWEVGGADFPDGSGGQVFDPVSYFGYNVGNGGVPIVTGEPYAAWTLEADYHDGQKRVIEQYIEARNAANTVNIRPLFFQLKRDALTPQTMLTGARILGNPLTICVPDDSLNAGAGNSPDRAIARFWAHNSFEFLGHSTSDSAIHLYAGTGRASSVQLGSNGQNDIFRITTVANSVNHAKVINNGVTVMHVFSSSQGATSASIAIGAQDNSAAGVFDTSAGPNGLKGVVVRGKSGITANLLEVQDSSSTVLSGFNRSGHFFTRKTSAPADSDLANGQLALWFDANGSGKLMVKARDNGGRIRTGSVNLN